MIFSNCLPILIIMMFIKTSYDYFWILNVRVLILKLEGPCKSYQLYETTLNYVHCATKINIVTAWAMTARNPITITVVKRCTYSSK